MWIVRLAMTRTYPFMVAGLLSTVRGAVSIQRMSTNTLANINITVVVHPGDDIPEGTTVDPAPLPR
jgi:hypothetical protein